MKYTVYPSLVIIQILVYLLVMSPFLFSLRYKDYKIYYNGSENYRSCVILLGVIFSVIASYDGDWYHYIYVVEDNYYYEDPITHIEGVHKWIIKNLSFGIYLWWRCIIWGCTFVLIWLSLKRINQNNLLTWTCVMAVCLIQMTIGRGYIGIALLFYGLVCILKPKIRKWSCLKGLIIMGISLIFHKSMFIYCFASILALYRYKNYILGIAILLIPVFIKIFTHFLLLLVMADELSHSAEGYLNDTTQDKGIGSNLYFISFNVLLALIFILFYFGRNRHILQPSKINIALWQNTYILYYGYLIVWGALTLNHIGNRDISMRILWGISLPLSVLLASMVNQKYKVNLNILIILGLIILGIYRLLYAYYLQKLGTGV